MATVSTIEPSRLTAPDVAALAGFIRERARPLGRPCIVAIDGRSGAGKSTLAAHLALVLDACVLDSDGFFAGGVVVRSDPPRDRARECIDWERQRPVLEALRAGSTRTYHAFDWDAFDGRGSTEATSVEPRPFVLFEGVYTARPELSDLVDLRILLQVEPATRIARLLAREGRIGAWERQWHEAEDWYFTQLVTPHVFDIIVESSGR
jgi:uridine kinase